MPRIRRINSTFSRILFANKLQESSTLIINGDQNDFNLDRGYVNGSPNNKKENKKQKMHAIFIRKNV
jgi:hypothetical protein